ncbi:hypothetical protein CC2G_007314 [Coprinopsis cinerea AmutBmut pab1-1]|nr:hypothetical protein CC2G_007314 [Coprinopsis cinerea AmutBmut pab1-1]
MSHFLCNDNLSFTRRTVYLGSFRPLPLVFDGNRIAWLVSYQLSTDLPALGRYIVARSGALVPEYARQGQAPKAKLFWIQIPKILRSHLAKDWPPGVCNPRKRQPYGGKAAL